MMEDTFSELPSALVEEMLEKSEDLGRNIVENFISSIEERDVLHNKLEEEGLLKRDSDLGVTRIPTTCGVDGAYAIDKLLANDIVAIAAVAIEGLVPPKEDRQWPQTRHKLVSKVINHNDDTGLIARGIMVLLEYNVTSKAPHDIIFFDGSFKTPLIYVNQALNKIEEHPLKNNLNEFLDESLHLYLQALQSERSDKVWASVPKYSSNKEISKKMKWDYGFDDRAFLSRVLKPGEFTMPLNIEKPKDRWHLKIIDKTIESKLNDALNKLKILYYRPHKWTPAFRIEISSSVASNNYRLGLLLQGIKNQAINPTILEPYPLYMADRMVKHIGVAMPAYRQIITKRMADNYLEKDFSDIFFAMHGYRTETGR